MWNYRNRVIHHGICSNPLEVILMAQSLSCRYRDIFSHAQDIRDTTRIVTVQQPTTHHQSPTG